MTPIEQWKNFVPDFLKRSNQEIVVDSEEKYTIPTIDKKYYYSEYLDMNFYYDFNKKQAVFPDGVIYTEQELLDTYKQGCCPEDLRRVHLLKKILHLNYLEKIEIKQNN